jgi:hypothetical protein
MAYFIIRITTSVCGSLILKLELVTRDCDLNIRKCSRKPILAYILRESNLVHWNHTVEMPVGSIIPPCCLGCVFDRKEHD